MRTRAVRAPRREAFTLIEIVVVMAIIVVLVSLTLAAVMKALSKPADVRVANDLRQLDGAIAAFMQKYGVEYIPSQISLHQHASKYTNSQLDQESLNFIMKTIGRSSPGFKNKWLSSTGIQWVQGAPTGTLEHEILEGEQCLVFFLGGIVIYQNGQPNCVGFSTDATNPDTPPTPGVERIGPFYQFDPNRLALPTGKMYMPAYIDAYGTRMNPNVPLVQLPNGQKQPVQFYAYFSSYKHQNGYNRYGGTDCPTLGVWPYASSTLSPTSPATSPQYVRPNDWQIICAGPDGLFGPGTNLSGSAGVTPYFWNANTAAQIPSPGGDDRANFAFGKLMFGE